MALFGKKDADAAGGTITSTDPRGAAGKKPLGFGRRKGAPVAPPTPAAPTSPGADGDVSGGFEDFSDFSEDALAAGPAVTARASRQPKPPRAPRARRLKTGTVIGINIGNDSIKAVEVRSKGGSIAVTGMGTIPTPSESISNGVVMSTTALSSAIRELLQKSGIKSKRVVSSVAGTGALVVRVIEVPKMSDNELKDNMAVDADRYIPFPPTEVILDFKALRELPTDPDNPNMEVLLAAAQREIVDLHVNVLLSAKLDPQAIDVEPLAAARAVFHDGLGDGATGVVHEPDYMDVSAIVNLGATNTEISVLRGDVLVFTRSIPRGAAALTEAISAQFDVNMFDAERLKREAGDALPPFGAPLQVSRTEPSAAAPPPVPVDDFENFDAAFGSDVGEASVGGLAPPAVSPGAATADWGDFGDFGAEEAGSASAETPSGAPAAAPTGSTDPFDLDFFNQGPQHDEPQQQHQQKQDEGAGPPPFDFSDFSIEEARAAADNLPAQVTVPETDSDDEFGNLLAFNDPAFGSGGGQGDAAGEGAGGNWHSAQHPDEIAPTGQMFHFDTIDDPSLPNFPALPVRLDQAAGFAEDDFSSLPTLQEDAPPPVAIAEPAMAEPTPAPVAPVPASAAEASSSPFAFGFVDATPDLAAPISDDAQAEFASIPAPAGEASVESASSDASAAVPVPENAAALPVQPPAAVAPATVPSAFDFGGVTAAVPIAVAASELDIDNLLNPGLAGATAAEPDMFGNGFAGGVAPAAADSFDGFDSGFGDIDNFGVGLTGDALTAGISAEQVHEVIAPLLDETVVEVRRSLEYFASRYPDSGVRRIALVGGGALLTNIDAYFTQSLGIPTTRANIFSGVVVRVPQLPQGYIDSNSPIFAVALGLALRDLT